MSKDNLYFLNGEVAADPGQESNTSVVCGSPDDMLVSGACQITRALGPYELIEAGPSDLSNKNKPASWSCKLRVPKTSSGPVTVRVTAFCLKPP